MIQKQTIPSKIEEIVYGWVKNNRERIKEIEKIAKNYKPRHDIKEYIEIDFEKKRERIENKRKEAIYTNQSNGFIGMAN